MSIIVPNEEFIKKNYDKTIELIKKVCKTENFTPTLLRMFEDLGDRYAICPASSHRDYYSAFPGGLCYHNLHVLQWIGRFASLLDPDKEYNNESLLKVCLLSEIGKIGDLNNDLYIPSLEDWKIKHGNYFEINSRISYMKINQRSLYLASYYGVSLTQDEYLAILLSDPNDESVRAYKYKEPKLALILQYANSWAQKIEKSNKINWP